MGARQPNGRRTMSGRSPMFEKSSGPGIASSLGEKLLRSLRSKVNSITAGTGTPSIRWIGDLNFGGHPPFLSTQLSPRGIIRPSRAAEPVQARETGALLDQRRRRNRKEEGDADWRFGAPRWGGKGGGGSGGTPNRCHQDARNYRRDQSRKGLPSAIPSYYRAILWSSAEVWPATFSHHDWSPFVACGPSRAPWRQGHAATDCRGTAH